MNPDPEAPVLVGVDGSAPSRLAIDLGVREAQHHRRPLRLVHAFEWPTLGVYVGPSPAGPPDGGLAAEADQILSDSLAHARAQAGPDLTVSGEVMTGAVVPVLLQESTNAALVVLGDRGLGGFTGLLVGSVAVQMTAHATTPLLIARGEFRAQGPVVVGVDGSPSSLRALEFAADEAVAQGAELIALSTWWPRPSPSTRQRLPLIFNAEDVDRAIAGQLAEALAPIRAKLPRLSIREQIHQERPARALLAASEEARLVVVGARGRGGFTGLLLGSVSQALVYHSRCPVTVIRAQSDDADH